jgi:hypothetical protein
MAKDASEIVIGSNGAISLGAVGDTVATDPTDALSGFMELGYATTDGVSFSDSPEILNVESWQASKPTRKKTQTRVTTASVTLQQWNPDNFVLAFGGGDWASEGGGVYRYDPPALEDDLPEHLVVIDWQDGDKSYRLPLHKVTVEGGVETTINRQGESVLPITFEVLEPDTGAPWNLYTDDPAFAPAGS